MLFVKKYKFEPPKDETKGLDTLNNSDKVSYSNEKFNSRTNIIESPIKHRNLMIGLAALFLAAYTALELTHFQFSSTYYQYIDNPVTASRAAQILSAMATSYTIGRFLSSIIAIKVVPEIMIIYHFCIIAVSMVVLYFGQNTEWILWVGNLMIGKCIIKMNKLINWLFSKILMDFKKVVSFINLQFIYMIVKM
jgi:hypothetical protein